MKSESDRQNAAMLKYGITREKKYIYHFGDYKYGEFELALAQALRSKKTNLF